jgi:hypothetical protein
MDGWIEIYASFNIFSLFLMLHWRRNKLPSNVCEYGAIWRLPAAVVYNQSRNLLCIPGPEPRLAATAAVPYHAVPSVARCYSFSIGWEKWEIEYSRSDITKEPATADDWTDARSTVATTVEFLPHSFWFPPVFSLFGSLLKTALMNTFRLYTQYRSCLVQ